MIQFNELPREIKEKMLERQEEFSGVRNIRILGDYPCGGFIFNSTPEGEDFWIEVLLKGNIDHFYTLYPTRELKLNTWYKNVRFQWLVYKTTKGERNFSISDSGVRAFLCDKPMNWVEATKEEVKEALLKECKRRGIVKGATVRSLLNSKMTKVIETCDFDFDENTLLYADNGRTLVFDARRGKFSEVLSTPLEGELKVEGLKDVYYSLTQIYGRHVILAMIPDVEANSLHYGYSICNPSDKFDPDLGKKIAHGRAKNKRSRHTATDVGEDHIVKEDVLLFCLDQVTKFVEDNPDYIDGLRNIKK